MWSSQCNQQEVFGPQSNTMPSVEFIETYRQASAILYGDRIPVPDTLDAWEVRIGKAGTSWTRTKWPLRHELEVNTPLKHEFLKKEGLKMCLDANDALYIFPADSMVYLLLELIRGEANTNVMMSVHEVCKKQVTAFPRVPRRKVAPQQLRNKWSSLKKLSDEKSISKMSALKIIASRMNKKSRQFPFFFEYLHHDYLFFNGLDDAKGIPWYGAERKNTLYSVQFRE